MERRKLTNKYYLSVEGETERCYFEHLRKLINSNQDRNRNAILYCKVEKNPISFVKTLKLQNVTQKTILYHVFDYEGDSFEDRKVFHQTLDRMKDASHMGKSVCYESAYSNLTFELWLLLHRKNVKSVTRKENYLKELNEAYSQNFHSLSQMKESNHMERIVSSLSIEDVRSAIERAELLERQNQNRFKNYTYRGYQYFERNPSTSVQEVVRRILSECGVL